jgi:signal peptidase
LFVDADTPLRMPVIPEPLRGAMLGVGTVLLVFSLLTVASGVWPPMVAVESQSMHPNLQTGDLVFVTGIGDRADVVTSREAPGRTHLGGRGDVVVFDTPEWRGSPIIHRAMFHVEAGENWYGKANASAVGAADDCDELQHCPAPRAGYITKGDNNRLYDQAAGRVGPVKREWVRAEAALRIPELGRVRLLLQRLAAATLLGGDGAVAHAG